MDKVKEFIALFWASTFNKIWLALVAVALGVYCFGNKNGWFKSGWKKHLPLIMVIGVVLSFVFKKYFLDRSTSQSTTKK